MMTNLLNLTHTWHAARTATAFCAALAVSSLVSAQTLAIKAERAFDGEKWGGPTVLIVQDGRVTGGSGGAIPDGAEVIEWPGATLTPGLIDAMCVVDSGGAQSIYDEPPSTGAAAGTPPVCANCTLPGHHHPASGRVQVEQSAPPRDPAADFPYRSVDDEITTPAAHAHGSGHGLMARLEQSAEAYAAPSPARSPWSADIECACCGDVLAGHRMVGEPTAAAVGPGASWGEQSSEVTPHIRVLDGVNLYARDFTRLLQSGVTTVFLTPDSANVIGGRGAIVKTGGPIRDRIVRAADAVKAALGVDPCYRGNSNNLPFSPAADNFTRRPTTRMGVDFVFRKAFYDAQRDARGLPLSGSDVPPREALPLLRELSGGGIPLRIQARSQHDILTALEYARMFDLRVTIEEATEAFLCVPQLLAAKTPVIYGPMFFSPAGWRDFVGESDDARLTTPRLLHEAGVEFSLTAQEGRDEEGLARQAMTAMRYGLPADAALRAVTSVPARQLGLADTLGTLGQGGDAVLWSGDPLSPTARPLLVVVGGQVAYRDRGLAKK